MAAHYRSVVTVLFPAVCYYSEIIWLKWHAHTDLKLSREMIFYLCSPFAHFFLQSQTVPNSSDYYMATFLSICIVLGGSESP
jgi:hypothetical protein